MVKIEDITGKKFSRWTVMKLSHRDKNRNYIFECLCECGKTRLVHKSNLTTGKSKSCGCLTKFEDLKGLKFGSLTVLRETHERRNNHRVWLCICDCGKQHKATVNTLKSGTVSSCGCSKSPDLTGLRYGKLEVIKDLGTKEYGKKYYLCKCDCGNKIKLWGVSLTQGWRKSCGCLQRDVSKLNIKKAQEVNKGKSHYNYNPNVTDTQRLKDRYEIGSEDRRRWRRSVYIRDDYTCQKCYKRSGTLNAHHLDGYNWHKEGRYDVNNGITLCSQCHIEFHKKYGYGHNTKEQFNNFISQNKELQTLI